MHRIASVVLCAALACGEEPRRPPLWVNLDQLNVSTWGAECGPQQERRRFIGVERTWQSVIDGDVNRPVITCTLICRSFGRQPISLVVTARRLTRTEAQQLIERLILRYLPRETGLLARGIAMWNGSRLERFETAHVRIEGGWSVTDEGQEVWLAVYAPQSQ